ncbi:MAG: MobA/MobL family protein, partial [Anaerobutyricum hallii]|nr:MobA/MobL family protein [Anaerobutyricum hallii]
QVFERGGVYLATKKIGKNNPKAHEIESDNQKRQEWNRAVDMALISGVPEPQILEVKRKQITESIKKSIAWHGKSPGLFGRVIAVAVEALEFLIESVLLKKSREVSEQANVAQAGTTEPEQTERIAENVVPESVKIKEEKAEPKQPEMTRLASKYPKFFKVKKELDEQNTAIQQKQKQLSAKKKELSEVKGWFKGRKKKELQGEIDALTSQIRNMKDYLPKIVQKIGYRSVQEFLKDFKVSQIKYSEYRNAIEKWKKETGKEPVAHSIRAKLAEKKQEIQNEQKNIQHTRKQNKNREAR